MTQARSTTDQPFRRREPDARTLTSERIASDLQAFESSGGHIEVLGVTRVLTRLDGTEPTPAAAAAPQPARPRGGTRRA